MKRHNMKICWGRFFMWTPASLKCTLHELIYCFQKFYHWHWHRNDCLWVHTPCTLEADIMWWWGLQVDIVRTHIDTYGTLSYCSLVSTHGETDDSITELHVNRTEAYLMVASPIPPSFKIISYVLFHTLCCPPWHLFWGMLTKAWARVPGC